MDSKHNGVPEREQRLDAVVAAYLQAVEAGQQPDRRELLVRHEDLLPELAQFFDDADALGGLALRSRSVKPAAALAGASVSETITEGKELGDFRIVREVGKGGMGIVYEAEQLSLRRRVALKILPFAATMDPRHLQRFHNEAQAAACLHHANIVPVYFVGCERSVHFYAMQFIEGQSLAELIAVQKHDLASGACQRPGNNYRGVDTPRSPDAVTLPIAIATTQASPRDAAHYRRIAEWGIQAAEALEHAHSLGIVHRDIKPANLMIDARGVLWITDFGLARTTTDAGLTMTGDVLGTLRYMSPEQALAKHGLVDHRSDIYALGATLYELLTLRPAIEGKDREEILRKITFEEPLPPRSHDRAIPADLETIVCKTMAKEPAERYATAQDLAEDLRRFQSHKPIRARPLRRCTRVWRWCRRNPFLAALTGLSAGLALALLMGSIVSTWLIAGQRDQILGQSEIILERDHDLRIHLYASDMKLAWQAWLQGELSRVHEILERHRPRTDAEDLRTFVWYYLQKLTRGIPVARSLDGHRGDVYYLAYSPDGQTLATAGQDGTTRLWDLATNRQRLVLHGDGTEVNAVAFSPEGQTLATASDAGNVHVWDSATGREQGTFHSHQGEVATVAFSPDGKTLASGGDDGFIRLWDRTTLKEKVALYSHAARVEALAFSPDGKHLINSGEQREKHRGEIPQERRYEWAIQWNLTTQEKRAWAGHSGPILAAAYSHNGRLIALGGDSTVLHFFDPLTFRVQHSWYGNMANIQSMAFSPDDRLLAVAGEDGVQVWDVASRSLRHVIPSFTQRVYCVAFSPDGRTLATCGRNGAVRLYDLGSAQPYKMFPTLPSRVQRGSKAAVSPDGQTAATQTDDYTIRSWKVATGELGPQCVGHRVEIVGMWFRADGKALLTLDLGYTARLWDLATGKLLVPPLRLPSPVRYGALSPDGSIAIIACDKNLHYWDLSSGEAREDSSLEAIREVALSPAGTMLAACADGHRVLLWDRQLGRLQHSLNGTKIAETPAFSPDGALLAIAVGGDIQLWNTRTGQELHTLIGHSKAFAYPVFSPDGKTLASGPVDHLVRLWDVRTGLEVARLEEHTAPATGLAFTPDGASLISIGTGDGRGGEICTWTAASADGDSPRK